MTINVNKEGEKLVLSPEGRIDTVTAPEFSKTIEDNIEGVKDLVIDFEKLKQYNSERIKHIESVDLKNMTATFSEPSGNHVAFLPDLMQSIQSMYNSIYISNISALAGYCKLSATKDLTEDKFDKIVSRLVRAIKSGFPDAKIQIEPNKMVAETYFKDNYYKNDVRLSLTLTYYPDVNAVQLTSYSGMTGCIKYAIVNEAILKAVINKTMAERFVEK